MLLRLLRQSGQWVRQLDITQSVPIPDYYAKAEEQAFVMEEDFLLTWSRAVEMEVRCLWRCLSVGDRRLPLDLGRTASRVSFFWILTCSHVVVERLRNHACGLACGLACGILDFSFRSRRQGRNNHCDAWISSKSKESEVQSLRLQANFSRKKSP